MADDIFFCQTVLSTKVDTKVECILPCFSKVGFIFLHIITYHLVLRIRKPTRLAYLKTDVGIICFSSCMPASMVPRQVLPDFLIIQEGMDTDLTIDFTRLVGFIP